MLDKIKQSYYLRLGIVTSILYSITMLIYFIWFYKKFEPIYGVSNEFMNSMYHDDEMSFFIISFIICGMAAVFIVLIYQQIELYNKPIISVNARLKSKESSLQSSGDYRGFSTVSSNYSLIFESENGVEISFVVTPNNYMIVFEGNKGILNYKQGILDTFVSFDITSIE